MTHRPHCVALIGFPVEIALAFESLLSSPDEAFPIVVHILIIEGRADGIRRDALCFLALLICSEDTSKIKIIDSHMSILTRESRCPASQRFNPLGQGRAGHSHHLRSVFAPLGAVVKVRNDERLLLH